MPNQVGETEFSGIKKTTLKTQPWCIVINESLVPFKFCALNGIWRETKKFQFRTGKIYLAFKKIELKQLPRIQTIFVTF